MTRSVGCWACDAAVIRVRRRRPIIMRPPQEFPISSCSLQPKRYERVVRAGAGRDDDELLARTRPIGHRICRVLVRNFPTPHFSAVSFFEGVEVSVATADKHQAAFRDHGASATIRRSQALRQYDAF